MSKTYAKLTNKLAVFLLIAAQLLHESRCSGFCDRAQILDNVIARHANTVVADAESFGLFININANLVAFATNIQRTVLDRREAAYRLRPRRLRSTREEKFLGSSTASESLTEADAWPQFGIPWFVCRTLRAPIFVPKFDLC